MSKRHENHTPPFPGGGASHDVMHRRPEAHRPVGQVPVQQRTTIALRCARDTLLWHDGFNPHDR